MTRLPLVSCAALVALGLACASPRSVRIRPVAERDLRGVVFLPFAASQVEGFFDEHGRPCPRFSGRIRDYFAGWQAKHEGDVVCDHDTFDDGTHVAALELKWQGAVPATGAFDVISGGYSVGAWGRVTTRASYHGDYYALARVVLDVRSPHCSAQWTFQLALAKITGTWTRTAEFTGWVAIPDTRIAGCAAGDPLEVQLRLEGESNRGKIEVDAFGFSVAASDELNQMFGVKPAASAVARPAAPDRDSGAQPRIRIDR